ncbi:uncharacterized acetyltransferase At3g50280-like [Phoenix dactylifera]|uniref:Uncharacterized acetyltransferase At3g50280-like n=1 Tax=Phoenix dactylifera TaxID=42345 RepID=A0A8B7MTJ3_PHODC|nr:uncharacterized acetyltransferase At3g50280-like [Phoenix dactylifera]
MANEQATSTGIHYISSCVVRPSSHNKEAAREQGWRQRQRLIHLTPWDLRLLSIDYIQKGILLPKPPTPVIPGLISSLSLVLDHFYPLAGRLATINHDITPPSLSVAIECNDEGVEFIHAAAPSITTADILTPRFIPSITQSFFPLNGAINHDGHSLPLLAVRVTELADGIFIGCALNHAVADGTSFWHFLNSWSEISRTGCRVPQISRPPMLNRWFHDSCSPPIHLPVYKREDFIKIYPSSQLSEAFFQFSAQTIAKLKLRANMEMNTDRISSLQALLALVWRSVLRAQRLPPNEKTSYRVTVNYRPRLEPPLPGGYFGNTIIGVPTTASAGEVLHRGLGWAASLLNQMVASQTNDIIQNWLESWSQNPTFLYFKETKLGTIVTGSSPRFDVYGNDFGWGRPIAVRSGGSNKVDGTISVFPGSEEGSMALDACLSSHAMNLLLEDKEFMENVT